MVSNWTSWINLLNMIRPYITCTLHFELSWEEELRHLDQPEQKYLTFEGIKYGTRSEEAL